MRHICGCILLLFETSVIVHLTVLQVNKQEEKVEHRVVTTPGNKRQRRQKNHDTLIKEEVRHSFICFTVVASSFEFINIPIIVIFPFKLRPL